MSLKRCCSEWRGTAQKKPQSEGLIVQVLLFCPISAFFTGILYAELLFV